MQNISFLFTSPVIKNLDKKLEEIFQNAPHLPKKAVQILVKIAPYLMLLSGLFLIIGGLNSIFGAHYSYQVVSLWRGVSPVYFYLIGLLEVLSGGVSLMAYEPLKSKKLDGWLILFCLSILELIMNLVSIFLFSSSLFSLLLSLLISLYVLYEIKPEYSVIKNLINKTEKVKTKAKSKK